MRILILLLCLSFSSYLAAQSPELVVQVGHYERVNDIEYSPDGKIIATCSEDASIKLWEIATGKEMKTLFGHSRAVNDIAFAPDGKTLISVSDDRKVIIWEIPSGKILKTIKEHKNKVLCIDYSPTGEFFATAGKDKLILLHNVANGKIKELYEFKSEVNKLKFLNSGEVLYSETDKLLSKNAFFSIPQGKMITWVPGGGGTAISFDSKDEKMLAGRNNYGVPNVSIIKDWHLIKDWRKNRDPLWKSIIPYNFQDTTGDFKIFKRQDNYDVSKVDSESEGAISQNNDVAAFFSKDGKDDVVAGNRFGELLFWRYDDIKYFPRTINPYSKLNEKIGNQYATPYKAIQAHQSPIVDAVSSKDGKYIFTSARNGEMKLWDTQLERNIQTFTTGAALPMYAAAFAPDQNKLVISTGIKDRFVIDLASMQVSDYFQMEEMIERITFSKDESHALVSFYNSSYFHYINMKTKEKKLTFKGHLGEILALQFSEDESKATSWASEGKKITWSLKTGEILSNEVERLDPLTSTTSGSKIANKKTKAVLTIDGKSIDLKHNNKITSFGFTPDEKFAFTASLDGALSLWNPQTGEKVADIIVDTNKEVIAVTHDFYFLASKNALRSIAFNHKGKMYPFEQFDHLFNRPDIVLERLGYADRRLVKAYNIAYKKRVKQMNINTNAKLDFQLPELTVELKDLPRSTDQRAFKFRVQGKDDNFSLTKLLIKINGVPLPPTPVSGSSIDKEIIVKLSEGDNKIQVTLENTNSVTSLAQTFNVTYAPSQPVKKDLYLITVGVSEYENSDFNLTYADKDAKDLISLFNTKKEKFENIHELSFFNSQATVQNIKAIRTKLEQSKIDDFVVFFFAGHGLLDNDLNYFLATHHIDFEQPEASGLAYETVESLMSHIPSRNKIIFIDACHSGELEKEGTTVENSTPSPSGAKLSFRGYSKVRSRMSLNKMIGFNSMFKFMKSIFADVRDNTGTIIISSAGGEEYALESDQWKNGVFTYYLKEGLLSNAADLNKDGTIYTKELQQYLSDRVFEATQGKQRPTARTENLSHDIALW